MQRDVHSVPLHLVRVALATYQYFVSLHGLFRVLARQPVLCGKYIGSEYEAYFEPLRLSFEDVLTCAGQVLDAAGLVFDKLWFSSAPAVVRNALTGSAFESELADRFHARLSRNT